MKLPRFTLRDLFWLVLVCALAVGWWVDRQDKASEADLWKSRAEYVADSIGFEHGDVVFEKWNGREAIIEYRGDAS